MAKLPKKALIRKGDIVMHKNAKWIARVKSAKKDYAYGLGKRSSKKMWLYVLEDNSPSHLQLLGIWSEKELVKVN